MKRLLYISTARNSLEMNELDRLLLISRQKNRALDVTGLLIVGGRRFLQLLEGPREAVDETFSRIERDARHFALVKLHDRSIDHRAFESWSMGFERGGIAPDQAPLEDQISAILGPIIDPNLRAYFTGFAKMHSSTKAA